MNIDLLKPLASAYDLLYCSWDAVLYFKQKSTYLYLSLLFSVLSIQIVVYTTRYLLSGLRS